MSTNFDFLRNFNNDLHYLASIIEDEIYDSPSAVLTDATTFLEIIVFEIYKKYELTTESLQTFNEKVVALGEGGFISSELKKNLIKTYRLRNKMHSYNGDIKNHLNLNKNRAVHIHKLLFNVSWLYYMEYCDDSFKAVQPSYTHPSRIKNEIFVENEIDDNKCIICENKTKTEDETFCSECKYKIEKCDNLKTLRKHFGFKNGFKRNQLIEMGFEKGYVGSFLQELKNDDLIYVVGKLNFIDQENTNQYIKEVEDMIAVEKLLSDLKLKNIDLNEILNHEFYQMGRNNQYPFVALFNIFNKIFYSKFIDELNSDITIEKLLNKSYLSNKELDIWYFNEKESASPEFLLFNEKLINEFFAYKQKDIDEEEIKSKFNIDEAIFNSIKEDEEYYHQREDECKFSLFLKSIMQEKVTKKEALFNVGLKESDLDKLLRKYPEFQKKYEKTYTKSRMDRFLNKWEYFDYGYALKRTGLIQEEIEDWLDKGQKTMKFDEDNVFSKFLKNFNNLSMIKYIGYRENKKTRHKSAKKVHSTPEKIYQLINENEAYKNRIDTILVNFTIEELKSGKNKEEVIEILDLDPIWLNSAIDKGQNGEDLFVEIYQQYSNNVIPSQINEFLQLIENKPLKSVLIELNISESELNNWYEKGKNGDETFKSFYNDFFEYKKDRYIKTLIKTGSKQKALKKSYFTPKELSEHENDIEKEIFDKSLETVIDELEKGNTTKDACKKTSFKIEDIYNCLEEGINGNEDFEELVDVFMDDYLKHIKKAYAIGFNKGISEKFIIKAMKKSNFLVNEDVKHLKRLNLFPKPEDVVLEMDEDFEIDFDY